MDILNKQKQYFSTGVTKVTSFRLKMLNTLEKALLKHAESLKVALQEDLNKPEAEIITSEFSIVFSEISEFKKHLKEWSRPLPQKSPFFMWPSESSVHYEPRGVALIIGPWNYPLQLLISPLIASISAGNCNVLKPSEIATATADAVGDMLAEFFDDEYLAVVKGGVKETTLLLEKPFDYIFFTGSTSVGKIVYKKAAENLVPCTLELGGKSPVVVTEQANLKVAARRIVWGKIFNAGQTCVAPDYLLVSEQVYEPLLEALKEEVTSQMGASESEGPRFSRIINQKNFDRLLKLKLGSELLLEGASSKENLLIEPTLLRPKSSDAPVMQEEVFGPLLPILSFKSQDQMHEFILDRPKPLAAYIFTESVDEQRSFIRSISAGSICVNDNVMQTGNHFLPFGGVGQSGFGRYHGKCGFESFSNAKSVMRRSTSFDFKSRYSPYSERVLYFLRKTIPK